MARPIPLLLTAAFLACVTCAPSARAQEAKPSATSSQEDTARIVKDVQKKLAGLTNYAVFDWLTFRIQGNTITLNGYASRPILKSEAENAVKKIPGVEHVNNDIEVLPLSPSDDRVRAAVYNRIYTAPSLRKYNANQGNLGRAIGPGAGIALEAGGITNSPPLGFHAIHIVVKNGHVTLYGVVNNSSDAAIAGMQANSAPGAFSVQNDLIVAGAPPKEK